MFSMVSEHSAAREQVAASDRPDTPRFPWQRMAFGLLASEELWRAAFWTDAPQPQETRDAAEAYQAFAWRWEPTPLGGVRGALGAHAAVRAGLGRWEETRRLPGARFRVACALKAAAPLLRDLAVFHAADVVGGIADRAALLQALADASDGEAGSDAQLRSQLLQAFEKTLGAQDGAFRSRNSKRKKRNPRTKRAPTSLDAASVPHAAAAPPAPPTALGKHQSPDTLIAQGGIVIERSVDQERR